MFCIYEREREGGRVHVSERKIKNQKEAFSSGCWGVLQPFFLNLNWNFTSFSEQLIIVTMFIGSLFMQNHFGVQIDSKFVKSFSRNESERKKVT
jgi:hypothetical protein